MNTWIPQLTDDGSYTFFSPEFQETFHCTQGAKAESLQKFIQATALSQRAQQPQLCAIDVCYGLGYNTAAALETIWSVNPDCRVKLYGLEQDPTVPMGATAPALLSSWQPPTQAILSRLAAEQHYQSTHLQARLLLGDARQTIQTLVNTGIQADVIFLDPFSPRRCPQLWTVEFLRNVAACLAPTGRLATYSRSASVRAALREVGLAIGSIPAAAGSETREWSRGTVAAWSDSDLPPLSPMEQEHLGTRAAIPLRDPTLQDPAATILQRHQQEQARSQAESTSSWRRRWHLR